MKKLLYSFMIGLAWIGSASGQFKQPLVVKQVWSSAPIEYTIVLTTIKNDPQESEEPIITRKVVGYVSAAEEAATGRFRKKDVNEQLLIPQKPVSYESDLPDLIGTLVGTVGNTVATSAGYENIGNNIEASADVLAALTNHFLDMAGEKMTKFYGITQTTMNFIELLPSAYYVIEANKVVVKEKFFKDFERFQQLKPEYIQAVKEFNKVNNTYSAYRREYVQTGKTNRELYDKIIDIYNNQLKPLLEKKGAIEQELSQVALQRFAFIPDFREPKKSCGDSGYAGPWSLNIYTYIGAKQTNIFNVDYCVKNPDDTNQNIILELLGNRRDAQGNFISGGIVIRNDDKSVVLPKSTGGSQPIWASPESNQLDWYSSTLVQDEAGTVKDYMLPFDIFKFETEYEKKVKEEKTAKNEKLLEKLKELSKKWKTGDKSALDEDEEEPAEGGEPKKTALQEKYDTLEKAINNSISQAFPTNKILDKQVTPDAFNDMKKQVLEFINSALGKSPDQQLTQTVNTTINEVNQLLSQLIQGANAAASAAQAKQWEQVRQILTSQLLPLKAKFNDAVSTIKTLEFTEKEKGKTAVKDIILHLSSKLAPIGDAIKKEYDVKSFQ